MKNIFLLLILMSFLSSCTKEKETKIVTVAEGPTVQNQVEHVGKSDAVEGVINSGGGKGVLCKVNGEEKVELLDLYEAKNLYNLEILNLGDNEEVALEKTAEILTKHLYFPQPQYREEYEQDFKEQVGFFKKALLKSIQKKIKFVDGNIRIRELKDSFEPLAQNNCKSVQVAAYYDESTLLIDKSLYNKMTVTHKMGLLAHESLYLWSRQAGETNSMATRKLVGHLFSKTPLMPLIADLDRNNLEYLVCSIKDKEVDLGKMVVHEVKNPSRLNLTKYFEVLTGEENEFGLMINFVNFKLIKPILFNAKAFAPFNRLIQVEGWSEAIKQTNKADVNSKNKEKEKVENRKFTEGRDLYPSYYTFSSPVIVDTYTDYYAESTRYTINFNFQSKQGGSLSLVDNKESKSYQNLTFTCEE